MRMRALLVPVITSCTAATAPAFADFGVLNYGGNNIPFTVGTGGGANIGNDGYTFSNHSTGPDTVTIGLKAIAWQGANFDLVNDVTYSSVVGGGSWLNRDANGAYLAATGAATETRNGNGNIVSYFLLRRHPGALVLRVERLAQRRAACIGAVQPADDR
jgi:hypothetical protein